MANNKSTIEIGQRFERLMVVERTQIKEGRYNKRAWKCVCDCGQTRILPTYRLTSGNTTSCGCFHREMVAGMHRTHGQAGTRTHMIWGTMLNRCRNKSQRNYQFYNSLELDPEFLTFEGFFAEVGEAPPGMWLDRKDNSKGYISGNLKWATPKEQQRNKSNNRLLTFDGETHCVAEWCELRNLSSHGVRQRLRRGATVEEALRYPCGNGYHAY